MERLCSIMFLTLLVIVFLLITSSFAHGRSYIGETSSKHIVNTIKVPGGDVVDCIDMYKQPSLSHPLLKNHTLQIQPSEQISELTTNNGIKSLNQAWQKYGRCPQGSIPIIRQRINTNHQHFRRKYARPGQGNVIPDYHQHAVIHSLTSEGTIHGGYGALNVWNPTIGPKDFSLSQIWVSAGMGTNLNTLEAGWHVFPRLNGDNQTRIFIYWTKDGYDSTGCYNLKCQGFVQTKNDFLLGSPLPLSAYGGKQSEVEIGIQKDKDSGNWWLFINGKGVGYWPASLMTSLTNAADQVDWGGEVYDSTGGGGKHTSTQMGSGHFPNEGYQKSSYIRDIKYIDTSGNEIYPTPDKLSAAATVPTCYDVHLEHNCELFLYFGGPGCR